MRRVGLTLAGHFGREVLLDLFEERHVRIERRLRGARLRARLEVRVERVGDRSLRVAGNVVNQIVVPPETASGAKLALDRMLAIR